MKVFGYLLLFVSAGLLLASAVAIVAGVVTKSGALLAFGVFILSLGLYLYYFSRTQLLKSKPQLYLEASGGLAAPKWVSWLLSISSLLLGVVSATNREIFPGDDWQKGMVPLLFFSLLGAISATSRRSKP